MRKPGIVQQAAESCRTQGALTDMLVAIKLRSHCGLRIVAMPHAYRLRSDRVGNLRHRGVIPFRRHKVIARDMRVTGIEADGDGRTSLQRLYQLGNLLEAAAERKLSPCGVLNQHLKCSVLPGEPVDGFLDTVCGEPEALITRQPFP